MSPSFIATFALICQIGMATAHQPNPWIMESDSLPSDQRFYPSIANGYLGTAAYRPALHITGVYNGIANSTTYEDTSMHCRVPNPIALKLILPNETSYKSTYQLNLYDGVVTEEINTNDWRIRLRQYAHQIYKTLLIVDITTKAKVDKPTPLNITLITLTLNQSMVNDMQILENRVDNDRLLIKYRPLIQEDKSAETPNLTVAATIVPQFIQLTQLQANWTFIMAALVNSDDQSAIQDLESGLALTANGKLYQEHIDAWHKLWDDGGRLDILGNNDLAQTVYSSYYYLLSSSPTDPYGSSQVHGWPNFGLSPASLAHSDNKGENYYGHIFWDQETWMLPALQPFQPDVIKRLLIDSRIRRIDQAKQKASKNGLDGAMFPWEVGYSGVETSPWEPSGSREIHITGDIAQFARQYMYWTNDQDFLQNRGGYYLFCETAKFWSSRLIALPDRPGQYGILDVMGPDEYQDHVNNSVYTNAIAAITLSIPDEFYKNDSGLSIPDPDWKNKADRLYLPFDQELQVHLQYDGYKNGTQVKQADVVLLGYPLLVNMNDTIRRNDLELYEMNTDPEGPCMTWAMHSVGWLDLHNETRAFEHFKRNFQNIQGPFKIWTETAQGIGAVNFITGIGGFLQNLLYGYLGLRPQPDCLEISPKLLPDTTGYIARKVKYLGREFTFSVSKKYGLKVEMVSDNVSGQCRVHVYGCDRQIPIVGSVMLPLSKYAIRCH